MHPVHLRVQHKLFLVGLLQFLLLGCSQHQPPELSSSQWQQQLNLPSVQYATELNSQWLDLVQSDELEWFDDARQRAVPVLYYAPKQRDDVQASSDKLPLIVFSHGLGGSRDRYAYLGKYWASQGFASLHVQHVGSDRQIWRGSRLTLPFRLMAAAGDDEALARVADVKFALTTLLESDRSAQIDQTKIVMAGHSYGANTSMLLVGAKVERSAALPPLRDPRFSAALLISAPPFYDGAPLAAVLSSVTVPTLHITNTMDEIEVPGYHSAPSDRIDLYQAMGGSYKVLAVFHGGNHNIFSGRRQRPELGVQAQVLQAATQSLSGAFLKGLFLQDAQQLRQWQQQHQTLLARFEQSENNTQVSAQALLNETPRSR
ncbi:acetylhydrolase [Rheinheimera riviphila]|uniref:Acetylhydrolase n=1 Tax=Rheinheimera riviphila TaxID=1834037 RepID=A0A437QM75_9GAMM|nr:acetylhydrolase [Rheinheimera riviphila]